jgi:hypothetical protein
MIDRGAADNKPGLINFSSTTNRRLTGKIDTGKSRSSFKSQLVDVFTPVVENK